MGRAAFRHRFASGAAPVYLLGERTRIGHLSGALEELGLSMPVALAPMAGITDLPFRRVVAGFGAGLVVSEMVASREMVAARPDARARAELDLGAQRSAVQLAGREARWMGEAARQLEARGARLIDINFGCPARKVVSKLCGSALMRDPDLAERIVAAVVQAVSVPVTVKMRLGWDADDLNAPDLARRCRDAGARLITVHGRTRCQFYAGTADWGAVRPVVEAVDVPVIVNGDIDGPESVERSLRESGAAGVMVGRAVQGQPWRLAQIGTYLRTGSWPPAPDLVDRLEVVLEHYDAILDHYGSEKGLRIGRKHLGWYINGLPGAAAVRQRINTLTDPATVRRTVSTLFEAGGCPDNTGMGQAA